MYPTIHFETVKYEEVFGMKSIWDNSDISPDLTNKSQSYILQSDDSIFCFDIP